MAPPARAAPYKPERCGPLRSWCPYSEGCRQVQRRHAGAFWVDFVAALPVMFQWNTISASNCARGCSANPETSMTERTLTLIQSALAGAMAIAILQFAPAGSQAADYDVGSIHVTAPWARATPKGASAGAAYLTITNNGTAPGRLSCAGSEAAAQCQIHTMTMDNGVMKMRSVTGGIEIKPGETVTLK